jgi:hypothetical protein
MTHDSTQVVAAARHARAKVIRQCLVALFAGLMAMLRTWPLFHEERHAPGRDRRRW